MYGFIYITTNLVNGKKYLGKRTYTNSGWQSYLGSGIYLRNAIDKYGRENFRREIIAEGETPEHLNSLEKFYINNYNCISDPMWYNIAEGGIGGNTYAGKSDEEMKKIRKKLVQFQLGKKYEKRSKGMKDKNHSDETKSKISMSKKGTKLSDEHKERIKARTQGKDNPSAKKAIVSFVDGDIKIFDTVTECSKYLNISEPTIRNIARSNKPYNPSKKLIHLKGIKISLTKHNKK